MNNFSDFKKSKYYRHQDEDYIFKFIEAHVQEDIAGGLIEIEDWIGDSSLKTYNLNNNNKLVLFGYKDAIRCYELDEGQIAAFEVEAISRFAKLMKMENGGAFLLPLKNTNLRRQIATKISGLLND
jgi:hypothetical protein